MEAAANELPALDATALPQDKACQCPEQTNLQFSYEALQRPSQTGNDDKFSRSLAKDYMESKDQETSKLIRAQRAKVSQNLLIGRCMKESNLEVNGADIQGKKRRMEMPKVIGRVSKCSDER